ncbi:unnamed protein product [Bathycoccus prasinos]
MASSPMRRLEDGRTVELLAHERKINSLDFNLSGEYLASGSVDQTIRVWDAERALSGGANNNTNASGSRSTTTNNNIPNGRLLGHRDSVEQLRFSPIHTDELVSVSSDKTVKFWDVRQKKEVQSIPTHGENINVAWSPNGKTVCVGDKNDTLTFIDCTTMRAVKTASGKEVEVRHRKPISRKVFKETEVNEFAWDREKESEKFFVLTGDGKVQCNVWDETKHTIKNVHEFVAHTGGCYTIAFDPSEKKTHFAIGSADSLVSIWNIPVGYMCLRTVARHETPVRTVAFSHDGNFLASASEDDFIDICDPVSSKRVCEPIFVRAPMNALAWHPKTYALAYAGDQEDLNKRKREALNLDEDLDAKASRMEEEERGNAGGRGGASMEENDRDDNRRRRSGNIKPNVNKVQQVEGIVRLWIPKLVVDE